MDDLARLSGLTLPAPPREMRFHVESKILPILAQRRRPRRTYPLVIAWALGTLVLLWFFVPDEWLLAMRNAESSKSPWEKAKWEFAPISALTEKNDFFVRAALQRIVPDRTRLIQDLFSGQPRALYATLVFKIEDSYPPIPDKTLTIGGTVYGMTPGKQYLIGFKKVGGKYIHEGTFGFVTDYEVQGEGPDATVSGLLLVPRTMRLDDAWKLIRSLYDARETSAPSAAAAALDKLKNGTLAEAGVALELLSALPRDSYTGADLVEALENQHKRLLADDPGRVGDDGPTWSVPTNRKDEFQRFAQKALKLLYPKATEQDVVRFVELYLADRTASNVQAFGDNSEYIGVDVLRLALKHPGPTREARVRSILGRRIVFSGKHGQYFYTVIGRPDYTLMKVLASTPGEDVDRIIGDVFAHPDEFQLYADGIELLRKGFPGLARRRSEEDSGKSPESAQSLQTRIQRYRDGEPWLFSSIMCLAPVNDSSLVTFLQEVIASKKVDINQAADAIRLKAPNPALVPTLREVIAGKRYALQCALPALAACGEPDEALRVAREALDEPIPKADAKQFEHDFGCRRGALLALGYLGPKADIALARRWLDPALLGKYQAALDRAYADAPDYPAVLRLKATLLRNSALLALTRLRDSAVAEQWRSVFQSGGTADRIVAATALHSLGDNTGHEIIDAFAKHEEKSIEDLQRHFSTLGVTSEFQYTALYLRSDATDALFLKRIEHGLGNGDYHVAKDLGFEMQHADKVLPLVAQHLSDRDPQAREEANDILRIVLGEKSDWDDNALAGAQPDKVERWQKAVAAFLATWTSMATTSK